MNLENMLNKSIVYDKVLKDAGFRRNGDGVKPWSLRYTNEDGKHVEIRSSEWTYETNASGTGPESLKTFLANT